MRRDLLVMWIALCAVLAWGVASADDVVFPYVGKVTAERVNVRAGGGINYRILKVTRKDDPVVVLGEAKEWLKIRCPQGCTAWVHSRYLKDEGEGAAVATADRVNVRATNSTRSASIAQLKKADRVEIVGKKDDWVKIRTPEDAAAWIFGEYVEYIDREDAYLRKARQTEKIKKMFADLERRLAEERASGKAEEWNLDSLINGYRGLRDLVALDDLGEVTESAAAKAKQRLAELTRIKELQDKLIKAREDIRKAKEEFERRRTELERPVPSYTAKGWVEDLGPIWGRPGTHRLKMGGETLYIIRSRTLDLYDYVGSLVGLIGRVSEVPGWDIEVIDVRKIDVLHVEDIGL